MIAVVTTAATVPWLAWVAAVLPTATTWPSARWWWSLSPWSALRTVRNLSAVRRGWMGCGYWSLLLTTRADQLLPDPLR
jgi:hypothetical protein